MPIAVMIESSEKTVSIRKICRMTELTSAEAFLLEEELVVGVSK
jgi:hypothetical protein